MKNVVIVTSSFNEQDSVTHITKNIIAAYKKIPNIFLTISNINRILLSPSSIQNLDFIIIVHPMVLIDPSLKLLIEKTNKVKTSLIFYIFGDYVRKSSFYVRLNDCLIGKKVLFYAASECYQVLIGKSLISKSNCQLCPFPIKQQTFNIKKKSRSTFRKNHGLKKKDFALIYTGRISPQKNILLLIDTFNNLKKTLESTVNLKLFIFGNVDEFEMPTFYEKKFKPGEYFQLLQTSIKNDDVKIFPRINHQHLKNAYAGSDLFISLSIYHDEDFGYSPIEALCSGVPVVLTNWGGYRDLQNQNAKDKMIQHIDLEYSECALILNEKEIQEKITSSILNKRISKSTSRKMKTKYSLDNISNQYAKFLVEPIEPFHGFHEEFISLSLLMLNDNYPALELYEHFYQSFWKNKI